MSDESLFVRLLYYGTVHLNRNETEVWLMPIGHLLDLWALHAIFNGWVKEKQELYIDQIISGLD